MYSITEKAYAKINLYLDILQKRDDGFHDILTIMQIVSLCDEVDISLNMTKELSVKMLNSNIDVPQEKNIAYKYQNKYFILIYKEREKGE